MQRLLKSAKFWTMIVDLVVSVATYFVGKYAGATGQDMLYVVGLLQPVAIAVIAGIFVEDAAAKKAGTFAR